MNSRMATLWERALHTLLVACAFLLPLAFCLRTYDSAVVKEVTLQAAAVLAFAFWSGRAVETGRVEIPASRARLAALVAALIAFIAFFWTRSSHLEASFFPTARLASFLILFFVTLTGPASLSFADSLAAAVLASAGLVSLYTLVQKLGFDPWIWKGAFAEQAFSTMCNPNLMGVFLSAAFPLALAVWGDLERSKAARAAAGAAALGCAFAVAAAGSPLGLAAFAVSSGAFFILAKSLPAAAAIPAVLAAAFALGGSALDERLLRDVPYAWTVLKGAASLFANRPWGVGPGNFAPAFLPFRSNDLFQLAGRRQILVEQAGNEILQIACELGLLGLGLWALIMGTVLLLGLRDASQRARAGQTRAASLMIGFWAAVFGLLACGGWTLRTAAPGFFFWVFAGALAGLALEGDAKAWVLPLPAPVPALRVLYIPIAAGTTLGLTFLWSLLASDVRLNVGVFYAKTEKFDQALDNLERVSPWHDTGLEARYFAAMTREDRAKPGDLEAALKRYLEVGEIFPHYAAVDLKKGVLYARLGDWEKSAESLKDSIRYNPLEGQAYVRLAEAESVLGRPEEARRAALALVGINPQNPEAWKLLADKYRELDRPRTARLMLRKARRIPDTARAGRSTKLYKAVLK